MFYKSEKEYALKYLLEESQRVLTLMSVNDFSAEYIPKENLPIYHEIVQNLNTTLNMVKNYKKNTLTRFEIVTKAIKVGLWDMTVMDEDPVNPNNKFIWTDEFRKMLGFKNEADFPNILDSWASRLHHSDKDWVLNAFASHLMDYSGQTLYDVEYQLQMKDGKYRWFRATGTTIRNKKGLPLRVAGVLYDIHDNKIKEQELHSLLTRFELINNTITEGPWEITVSVTDSKVLNKEVWWSSQFRKLLKYEDKNDFPNNLSSWINILHPEDKERVLNAFEECLNDYSGKTPYSIDYRLLLKNGEYRWFHATGETIRNSEGIPLRIAGTLRDISIEKEVNYLIRQLNKTHICHKVLTENLSNRETEVLLMLNEGISNKEISEKLSISINTVIWHLRNIYGKLGVKNRTAALNRAREHGIIKNTLGT